MRVIVPYVTLYPETRAALEAAGVAAEYGSVAGDDYAYHELLRSMWAQGEGFINIEQDIVVRPDTVDILSSCPEPWCGFAYAITSGYGSWLGCVKFSTELVSGRPSAFDATVQLRYDGTPRRHWARIDTRLKQVLEDQERLTMHVHWPAVGHLNPAQRPPVYNCPRCGAPIPDEVVAAGPGPYECQSCTVLRRA